MTSSEERCPTCDGTGFVTRDDQHYSCPTCSPRSDVGRPHLTAEGGNQSHALRIARTAAYLMGAAALVAVLALLLSALWH
jgi:hypothetical protein